MTRPFNILLSSAGRRVALLEILRCALGDLQLEGKVIAADVSPMSSAFHRADDAVLVPRCTSPEFIPSILQLCRERRIQLVIPTIDTELPIYAAHRAQFLAEGIHIAVSSSHAVDVTFDKVKTHEWLLASGLPTVRQTTPEFFRSSPPDWSFPLLVKPRGGSLSKGVDIVRSQAELELATGEGDFVVQSIAPGHEFTIDFLANRAGECVCAVPRKRLEVRGGEISKGITVRSEALEGLAARVCKALPSAYGCLNVQVFQDEQRGELNVIEVNARFGGGFPLSWEAGARYPTWMIEEILGLASTASASAWRAGLVMLRYDEAVFVDSARAGV